MTDTVDRTQFHHWLDTQVRNRRRQKVWEQAQRMRIGCMHSDGERPCDSEPPDYVTAVEQLRREK